MQYFDLHCDTLYKAVTAQKHNNTKFEISADKIGFASKWCQCFAIWIPDDLDTSKGIELFIKASALMENYSRKYKLEPFHKCNNDARHQYILTLENASILAENPENIDLLTKHNIRMVTLTWNAENSIGGGADAQHIGLTEFGKYCVKEFENRNIIIDVSHASDKTFYDVLSQTTKSIAASHSNARSLCAHKRNLADEQFKEIVKRKGVVGLNFHKDFLNNKREEASITDVLKHTEHFLSLGGEDVVCIGSDFDGADPISELSSIDRIPNLYESYLKIGYNEQLVQKIMYNNAYNFLSRF